MPGINKSRSNKKQPTVMKSMSGRVIKKPKLGLDAIPFFFFAFSIKITELSGGGQINDPSGRILFSFIPHLSKGPSDLEQNGTQEKTPFSGPVFHGLSRGVVCFVPTVSFWNHQIEASHWMKEEF